MNIFIIIEVTMAYGDIEFCRLQGILEQSHVRSELKIFDPNGKQYEVVDAFEYLMCVRANIWGMPVNREEYTMVYGEITLDVIVTMVPIVVVGNTLEDINEKLRPYGWFGGGGYPNKLKNAHSIRASLDCFRVRLCGALGYSDNVPSPLFMRTFGFTARLKTRSKEEEEVMTYFISPESGRYRGIRINSLSTITEASSPGYNTVNGDDDVECSGWTT